MIKAFQLPLLLATAILLTGASPSAAQQAKQKQPQPKLANSTGGTSPHETTSTVIGADRKTGNRVTITYGRPFSKHPRTGAERKVWGTLVPWEKAYRLGADEATLLITQKPIVIGGTTIPAGAYTLYMIPSERGTSKLAFSKKIGDWGVPVDEGSDLARVDLKRETLAATANQLTILVENVPNAGGLLKIIWENTQFSVPFTVKG